MRLPSALALLLFVSDVARAASGAWGFEGASVSVVAKKASVDGSEKILFDDQRPVPAPVTLGPGAAIKVKLTTTENNKAARPHQAFLLLRDADSGLETPFPLKVGSTGQASVDITHKDLPIQLILSKKPLQGSLLIGSFGSSRPTITPAFDVALELEPNVAPPAYEPPLRYGKREELSHTFRPATKRPLQVVSLAFAALVASSLPVLFAVWYILGANVKHLSKALAAAPVAHTTFLGSILAMEGAFLLYSVKLNLFQALPIFTVIGAVAVLSGMRALGEVQGRRLAGER